LWNACRANGTLLDASEYEKPYWAIMPHVLPVRLGTVMRSVRNDAVILKSSDTEPRLPTYHFAHAVAMPAGTFAYEEAACSRCNLSPCRAGYPPVMSSALSLA